MHENLMLLDSELLILLDESESIDNASLTDMLICDNSNSDSDYKDDLVLEIDSVNRQELKESAILLRIRI